MGGTQSSYQALDWFNNFGSGVADFFGTVTGDFMSVFKNFMNTGTSLLSSPIFLIGGGLLVLYLLTSSGGSKAEMAYKYLK